MNAAKKAIKYRTHREWFRPVERKKRKSCPSCKAKLEPGEWIWCWGEYVYGKWRNVKDVCKACWPSVREELNQHGRSCGCVIELTPYHATLPKWLTLKETPAEVA